LLDPHALPILPAGYTYLGGGHKSVWLLNTMLQRTASFTTGEWASSVLDSVSADYLSVHRDDQTHALITVWRIQFDGPSMWLNLLAADGSLWRDTASGEPSTHVYGTVDGDLVLVATTDPDAQPVLPAISGWQPLEALPAKPAVTRLVQNP
jgi:hypothetical protein